MEPTLRSSLRETSSLERVFRPVDWLFNRVYTSRWNPLYQSGSLAVVFLAVCAVTGIYLFIFYRVADPYASVEAIENRWWGGSLMRSLHRYSADLAMAAVFVHALKMFLARRTWGPRAMAWVAGVCLLGALLLCGWTGLVMAWDVQGQVLAIEGAKLMDLLPIFAAPISRSFLHPGTVPPSFFFMNLFLHVALPLGLAGLLWLHLLKVARPRLLPPKEIRNYALGVLLLYALLFPAPLPPPADLLAVPVRFPTDLLFGFWLPLARAVSTPVQLLLWVAAAAAALSIPWWWRPRRRAPEPSVVEERHCTGCSQCYQDCPYDAISMVAREVPSRLTDVVARVDPALCISCGICSGSCAPMGLGPPQRTGRDQLPVAESFIARHRPGPDDVVVFACREGLGADPRLGALPGVLPYETGCSGAVHTSVVELILRRGAGGALMLSCPERDCRNREGPRWLVERLFHDREAELKERVDKRRVRVASLAATELPAAVAAIEAFRASLGSLAAQEAEAEVELDLECEVVQVSHG